ncbi:MAG: hypothetical protein WA746_32195 [Isosphaeraceae bacterium]
MACATCGLLLEGSLARGATPLRWRSNWSKILSDGYTKPNPVGG